MTAPQVTAEQRMLAILAQLPDGWEARGGDRAVPLVDAIRACQEHAAAALREPATLLRLSMMTLQVAHDDYQALHQAATELLEVADLRGDSELPHPANDPRQWTARMQDAWNNLRALLQPEPPKETQA